MTQHSEATDEMIDAACEAVPGLYRVDAMLAIEAAMNAMGVTCPGCDTELTNANAGGYRCFCQKCVDAMPSLPTEPGGYCIEGTYPSFRWVSA